MGAWVRSQLPGSGRSTPSRTPHERHQSSRRASAPWAVGPSGSKHDQELSANSSGVFPNDREIHPGPHPTAELRQHCDHGHLPFFASSSRQPGDVSRGFLCLACADKHAMAMIASKCSMNHSHGSEDMCPCACDLSGVGAAAVVGQPFPLPELNFTKISSAFHQHMPDLRTTRVLPIQAAAIVRGVVRTCP